MNVNEWLRMIAGSFVLISVALGAFVSPWFLLFTAFVGLNLLQSSFTRWCPMMSILRSCGVKEA
jgi:Inner membrane protein YgaP-like, transmembrane domain